MNKLIVNSLALSFVMLTQAAWADDSGKSKFDGLCAACHGAAGVGIEGMAPPLKNPDLWKSLGGNGVKYIAGVMTGGMSGTITVDGIDYRGLVMPPQASIDSAELATIAQYVAQTLNTGTSTPSVALINELKAAPLSHTELRAIRKGAK